MLCDNCGKREANVRYSENINGVKREMHLCEECSKKLGITNSIAMDFSMPLDFPSFFGSFLEDFATPELMPMFKEVKQIQCESCGFTFDDIVNTGRLGCPNCYNTFEEQMAPILKKIQGANQHIGRIGKISNNHIENNQNNQNNQNKENKKDDNEKENSKLKKLQEDLQQAIKEERYEDAAKLRDEIKKIEKR